MKRRVPPAPVLTSDEWEAIARKVECRSPMLPGYERVPGEVDEIPDEESRDVRRRKDRGADR